MRSVVRWCVVIAAILFPAVTSAAAPQWRASESEHFIIYSKSPSERVEALAADLESYDKLMRMASRTRDEAAVVKVRIYEVDSTDDVERALGLSDSGVAGFYDSNILGPYLVTPRMISFETSGDFTVSLVLHHEYAHHFMLQYFPAIYPDWYVEGFAELIGSSKRMSDGRIGYGMPAKQRGPEIAANWVPLQELLVKEKVTYFDTYGQGWVLAHFFTFFSPERTQQFRAYLHALAAGKSLKEAAEVFGDLDELNRDARRYLTGGTFSYRPVKVEITRPAIQRSRPLSAAEVALIPEVIAFNDGSLDAYRKVSERDREKKRREALLQSVREKASAYPTDPFALYFLGEVENSNGNYSEAQAAVDRLLAIQPTHVRAMARKSMLLARQAATLQGSARTQLSEQARLLAVKANQTDINNPLPLLAYYESFRLAGEKAPEAAVQGLMQAVSTLPRDDGIRMLLVNELESDRRYAEAIGWIMPIANDPHESPMRSAAREQLARLRQEQAK
jgi:tetratricopeptide (TPR) repeat protein